MVKRFENGSSFVFHKVRCLGFYVGNLYQLCDCEESLDELQVSPAMKNDLCENQNLCHSQNFLAKKVHFKCIHDVCVTLSRFIMLNFHGVVTHDTTLNIKHGFCGLVCAFPESWDHSVCGNRRRGWYLYTRSNTGHIREICVVVNAALIGPHLDHLCPTVTHYSAMSWLCSPSVQALLKKEQGDVGVRGFLET